MTFQPDAFDQLIKQINEMLKMVKENQISGKELPADFEEKLMMAEGLVNAFQIMNEETLKSLEIPEQKIADAVKKLKEIPESQRFIKMKGEVEEFRNKRELASKTTKLKKKPIQERQKKFRRLGGHGDWKPL